MERKPITAIFNDVHLKQGNEEDVMKAFDFLIKSCKELEIKDIVLAGDMFDVRKQQRLSVLKAFQKMIEKAEGAKIILHAIPGNHDKPDYASPDSYLDIYESKYFKLYEKTTEVEIEGVKITLMPFFIESLQVEMIEEAKGSDILISHFELNGSTHLGRVAENRAINKSMLKKWKKVYLGHYHNWHEITKDIVHLPSFMQNNFGEDDNKGFTIIYNDLSYEIKKGVFKRFETILIDADTITPKEMQALIETHKNSEKKVRFDISGSAAKLKGIDKEKIKGEGISLILRDNSFLGNETTENEVKVKKHTKETIEQTFQKFCDKESLNIEKGFVYLHKFLKEKDND